MPLFAIPDLLLAAAVSGVRSHSLYQPLLYGGFIAIGSLRYPDDNWVLLAGLFVLGGIIGLISEFGAVEIFSR